MRKSPAVLPVVASTLALAAAAPAPAAAVMRGSTAAVIGGARAAASGGTTASLRTTQARFGGGFRSSRRPSFGPGSRYRAPGYRRPHAFRGFGGSILRALGIAYLVHALFGLGGGGGSPFGLLIVVALIAWIVARRRRRYAY